MKMIGKILLPTGMLALALGCGGSPYITRTGSVSGHDYQVTVRSSSSGGSDVSDPLKRALDVLEARIHLVRPDKGALGDLNEKRSLSNPPAELTALLAGADSLKQMTDGAFDYRQGVVKELWDIGSSSPDEPNPGELSQAVQSAAELLVHCSPSSITLEGSGKIEFGRYGVGWAVDGATEELIRAGIVQGSVTVDEVTRVWGVSTPEEAFLQRAYPPTEGDSMWFLYRAPEGGSSSIHIKKEGFEYQDRQVLRVLDPRSGEPCDSLLGVIGWAPNARVAGGLSEALAAIGREESSTWLANHQPAGVVYFYHDPESGWLTAEGDVHLTPFLTDSLDEK